MKRYMITVSCDPYHANTKYNDEEVIRYDGKTPIEWIVDDFAGIGYNIPAYSSSADGVFTVCKL